MRKKGSEEVEGLTVWGSFLGLGATTGLSPLPRERSERPDGPGELEGA